MDEFGFSPTTNIFKNRDSLSEEYIPEELVGRDQELREFHRSLQPVIENENPSNILLYGKSGVGKTASTRYMLTQLESSAETVEDVNVVTVNINCEDHNTGYQAAVAIVNSLREYDDQISSTGYPLSTVLDYLMEEIDSVDGTVLIVLDEIDALDDDKILYKLSRANEEGYVTDTNLGVIGISNDLKYRDTLRKKVRSSLCEKTVLFTPYDARELTKVLEQRMSIAFKEGVVDEGAVQLCAALGSRNSGDARMALDLLRESGDIARSRGDEKVREPHVQEAKEKIETDWVLDTVQQYSLHGKFTLLALILLYEDGKTPCRSRVIVDKYTQICKSNASDPVSNRAVRDYLSELEELSITMSKKKTEKGSGGHFKEHDVVGNVDEIKSVLQSALLEEA